MPQDKNDDGKGPSGQPERAAGRTYRGEAAPSITTAEEAARARARRVEHAGEAGAVPIQAYFAVRGINNPIVQASMLAWTDVRVAPVEVFDDIFVEHHGVPAAKPVEEREKP